MRGEGETVAGDDFAELLRELKERSGLSYGALGKRLHMSGSTLHRYVSGEVVPVEFAPVERLARVCRATPEELLELHRRWIRADALRGVKKDGGEEAGTVEEPGADERETSPERETSGEGEISAEGSAPPAVADPPRSSAPAAPAAPSAQSPSSPSPATPLSPVEPGTPDAESESEPEPGPAIVLGRSARPRRRVPRVALYAASGVVAVGAAVALVANLVSSPDGDGQRGPAGAVAQSSVPVSRTASGAVSPSASASTSPSPSASASASRSPSAPPSPPAAAAPGRAAPADGPLFTVSVSPYHWDVPCDHAFLVDRSPKNVPEPPPLQGAVGWAVPLKAVSANRQMAVLTVQGTGAETVVLNDLHVRVVSSGPPLDWNQYVMGNGCGGQVDTKAFDVSLDLGTPLATPIGGQRDFPYSVTQDDPEVFFVNAHTSGHDVSWYLELEWSSGGRHGIMRVDDHGTPFRTSASRDDSYYAYPLGSNAWELVEGE